MKSMACLPWNAWFTGSKSSSRPTGEPVRNDHHSASTASTQSGRQADTRIKTRRLATKPRATKEGEKKRKNECNEISCTATGREGGNVKAENCRWKPDEEEQDYGRRAVADVTRLSSFRVMTYKIFKKEKKTGDGIGSRWKKKKREGKKGRKEGKR